MTVPERGDEPADGRPSRAAPERERAAYVDARQRPVATFEATRGGGQGGCLVHSRRGGKAMVLAEENKRAGGLLFVLLLLTRIVRPPKAKDF